MKDSNSVDVTSVNSGAFEFYEGLRILIPGSFVLAIYVAIGNTFGFVSGAAGIDVLPGLVGALFAGLFLFFVDVPSRAAVFAFESPERVLRGWGHRPPPGGNHLNVYYEILDTIFPTGIRSRTYYLGVIYRIGFESIYLLALPAVSVLAISSFYPEVGTPADHVDAHESRVTFVVAAALILVALAASIRARAKEYRFKDRAKLKSEGKPASVMAELWAELPRIDFLIFTASIAATVAYVGFDASRYFGTGAVIATTSIWAFRYLHGVKRQDRTTRDTGTTVPERQNLHVVSASVFTSAPVLLTLACSYSAAPNSTTLSAQGAVGWSAALVLAATLVHFRSHERKLLGSYGLQRTWLLRNREKIEKDFYGAEPAAASASAPITG